MTTIRIHGQRPMHQIQINILQPQLLQTQLEILLHARMIGAPELGSDEEILALDLAGRQCRLDALADFFFVLVAEGRVDVSVSDGDGMADCSFDLAGAGLPGSWSRYVSC